MIKLARLFDTTRFERRPLGTGKLGILSPPARLRLARTPESPACLGPILDRRIEREAQDIIVAGELLAIYDRALDAKFRRG